MSFVFEVGKLVFDIEGFIDELKIYHLAKYIFQNLINIAFVCKTRTPDFDDTVGSGN